MSDSLIVGPTADPRRVRTADGRVLTVPEGWALLPPGDAGLTRRVKAAGPSWTVQEKVGRKLFSRGVWAPQAHILQARAALEAERATPAYEKKLAAGRARRAREQEEYEVDFANSVLRFLAFSPAWMPHAKRMAVLVAAHATPVGSGTVARTERIPIERRAEAAVIAWMRHQTTSYDDMRIARVKGARREVRRELAEISRAVLDLHRRDTPHGPASCPLCRALAAPAKPPPTAP
ncbi:DUF2293 domain-containing protein [Myxococcus sp. RHSTA-1-4]|uniref:DUF2293 domain-containing protein n=1 Tax=Myxococcus sp. RHSTA-1-4 TaxID=2874601 RepID=UPI001CBC886C|nr:DUF2293 domain-containing protein [Myxococcus sp. RHSTA-1-4]MBZ4422923.1 DUF2293 domain-containing protein [Myxococcus sp. RHSTA-1-4]